MTELLFGNPDAGIADIKHHIVLMRHESRMNTALRSKLGGIVDKIHQHLGNPILVAVYDAFRRRFVENQLYAGLRFHP